MLHSKTAPHESHTLNINVSILMNGTKCQLVTRKVNKSYNDPCLQGRIKGFVGPGHYLSLGPFGDSKSIGTTAYSRLSVLMEEMHG